MAHKGLEPRKNSIRVQLYGVRWNVPGKPTKTQQALVARQRASIKSRVDELGEDIHDVLADVYGQKEHKRAGTLGYYFQHFIDVVAPETVVRSTLMGYESAYNANWREFDNTPINRIPITQLQRALAAKEVSKKTRRNALSVLRLTYDCAVPEVFDKNPIDDWTIPRSKDDPAPEPDPYDDNEWPVLLSWLHENEESKKAWRYFTHGFGSGMRTGELLGAPWDALEKPYEKVTQEIVRRKVQKYTKTTNSQGRVILLPEFVWDMLGSNPTRFKKTFIHLNTLDSNPNWDADWYMMWWKQAHEATGVRRRTGLYPWRSTYISMMISAGEDEYDVARFSGNSPAIIKKHYLKHQRDTKADEAYKSRMDQRFMQILDND